MHRERVRERRRLEIDVEAARERGRCTAVDRPRAAPVSFEDESRVPRPTDRQVISARVLQRRVDHDHVADTPGHSFLDRRRDRPSKR